MSRSFFGTVAPLAMLVSVVPALGILLILLLIGTPVAFARLDP